MKLRVGVFESSRIADIERIFHHYYPDSRLTHVKSHLQLSEVDAVLAGGGPDLNPELYGQEDRACRHVNKARDARDLDLMHGLLGARLPFLGLCRGAQLLNVALNGTLYQDLATERGQGHLPVHSVAFSGTGARHLGDRTQVNSTHHQGIDRLGDGLEVIGRAADGLPEAWFRAGAIGVQFHPETLIHENPSWLRLFDWWLAGAA
ncbi:gamma-glutamyl-gamma-aminobutyrate hydrolase family protein [Deinococcus arcticus]|uniref:Peptidase C26 n=1 Tax=Deinococcus arcticus TaxID=2136176 RepID=A0A2T3W5A3_9DEIO|nr:gamma-glutamyl-gamma-aminobutyrate hydrolase family protein [Deinococcus arcticus]PTA66943.1 peptidase C26 [Deinococcus arcticus]